MPDLIPSAELKLLRERLGLSQEDMAHKLELKHRTYVRYERGEVKTVPSTVMDAARKLAGRR